MARFIKYPFALNGNKTPEMPMDDPETGLVSYEGGYTLDYQLDLETDPDAKPISRVKTNSLYFDITDNINQYQTRGVPAFITTADNLGVAWEYAQYARVIYDNEIWENQIADNNTTPSTANGWIRISGNAQGVPIGTVIHHAGIAAPFDYLVCDGSDVPRSTYQLLFEAITKLEENVSVSASDPTFDVVSTAGLFVGMVVEGGGLPTETIVTNISSLTITVSNDFPSTTTTDIRFFMWGQGDGSSTFGIPGEAGRVRRGAGVSVSGVIGANIGDTGGESTVTLQASQIPAHNHSLANAITFGTPMSGGSGAALRGGVGGDPFNSNTANNIGGGGAHNNVQPSINFLPCIKYA